METEKESGINGNKISRCTKRIQVMKDELQQKDKDNNDQDKNKNKNKNESPMIKTEKQEQKEIKDSNVAARKHTLFYNPILIKERQIALDQKFMKMEYCSNVKLAAQTIVKTYLSNLIEKIKIKQCANILADPTKQNLIHKCCNEFKKSLPNLSLDSRNKYFSNCLKNNTYTYVGTSTNSRSIHYMKLSPEEQMGNILKEQELNQKAADFCRRNFQQQNQMRKEKENRLKSIRDKYLLQRNIENEIKELDDEEKVALKKIDIMKRFKQAKRAREDSRNKFKQLLMQTLNSTPFQEKRKIQLINEINSHSFNFDSQSRIKESETCQNQHIKNSSEEEEEKQGKKVSVESQKFQKLLPLSNIIKHLKTYENYKFVRSKDREKKIRMLKTKEESQKILIRKFKTKIIQKVLKDDKELKEKKLRDKENVWIRKEKMKVYADIIKEAYKPKINEKKTEELLDSIRKLERENFCINERNSMINKNTINKTCLSKISKRNSAKRNPNPLIKFKLMSTEKEEPKNKYVNKFIKGILVINEKNQVDQFKLAKAQTTKNKYRPLNLNCKNSLHLMEGLKSNINTSMHNQAIFESVTKDRIKLEKHSHESSRTRKTSLNKILLPNWKKDLENHNLTINEKVDRIVLKAVSIEQNAKRREEFAKFQRINTNIERRDLINNMYVDAIKAKLSIFDEFHKA